jgi:hypothetical protein
MVLPISSEQGACLTELSDWRSAVQVKVDAWQKAFEETALVVEAG